MNTKLTDLARTLNLAFGPALPGGLPTGFAMTDPERTPDLAALISTLPAGVGLIFRHYGVPNREALARSAVRLARRRGRVILIADDPVMAYRLGADGIHLPEYRLKRPATLARTRLRPDWLVSAAAHGMAALRRAALAGVDMALLSPVFQTPSHRERAPLGTLRFTAFCRAAPMPVYGLGGLTTSNIRRLKQSGAAGIAGIGMFAPR